MAENKRLANYELLRVIAMVMVVVLHFLSHSDSLLKVGFPADGVRVLGTLMEAFCLVAVNVYLLISGYFGVRGSFRPGKVIRLLCQIWFYSLLILGVMTLTGIPTKLTELGPVYGLVQYLFPIETEHYWFATSYFFLYLFSPVLNTAAGNMTQKQFQAVLGGLLIFLCLIKSISPVVFVTDRYGYDLPWFLLVYLLGAYLGLYGNKCLEKHGFLIYTGSSLGSFLLVAGLWLAAGKWESLQYYFTVPFHYNFVLCLTGALGLFGGFSRISLKEGKGAAVVRKLGALSFGVYLFHEHIDLRDRWYESLRMLINPAGKENLFFFFAELIFCVILLFAAGILIDYIRSILFQAVENCCRNRKHVRQSKEANRDGE